MTAAGALAGALVAAFAIYLLAWKQGVSPYRLVLVGIGVAALLSSVTQYLLTRAEIFEAQRAVVWLTGSLNGRGWEHVRTVGLADLVLIPVVVALLGPLRVLQLGDDSAKRPRRGRRAVPAGARDRRPWRSPRWPPRPPDPSSSSPSSPPRSPAA